MVKQFHIKMQKTKCQNGFKTYLVWRSTWRHWVYYLIYWKNSPIYAKAVVSKFFEKVEILKDFPELGRAVPEINDEKIREIFVYSYRLIYKLKSDSVLFIAVIHGKRLLENHN